MKKFFKALALVLALTLVLGTIPVSAASTYDIKTKRTMYVAAEGQDVKQPVALGTKTEADGTVTKSTARARLTYAKLLGIDKAEASKHVISVSSTNNDIVKANDEKQAIRAYAIGEVTLTITVDSKVEGTVKVTAKKNSSDATIVFGTKRDIFEDRTVTLNKEYELSLPRNGADTDARKLVVKNEKGEDVTAAVAKEKLDEKGKSTRLWTLKFTTAGKYTIQGFGFQSAKYPDIISTGKAITVEAVKAIPEKIAQTASNAFTMYFEDGVSVDKNEFSASVGNYEDSIYELVAGSKVPFGLIAKDGIAFAKDAEGKDIENQIVVTTFKDFEGGKTYYVKYAGKDEPYKFEAVGTAPANVTAVKILRTTVPAGDNYDAWVHAYNGDVDITHALDMENITTLEGGNDYAWPSGLTVYFSEADRTCTFTASLSKGYDNNGNEVVVKSEPVTIKSYDGAEISDVIYRFKYAADYDDIEVLDRWKDASLKRIAVDDQDMYLQILVKNAAGNYVSLDEAGITSVKVANDNIAQITPYKGTVATSDKGFSVNASNAGTTSFILYKERPSDGVEIPVKSCEFTVLAKRQVKEVKVDFDKQQLNLSMGADDAVVYTITVKDQHGDPVTGGAGLSVQQTDNKKNGTVNLSGLGFTATWQAGVYTFTVPGNAVTIAVDADGNDVVKIANFQLTFSAVINGWPTVSTSKGLTAAKKSMVPKTWNVITSGTSLDTNIITDNYAGSQTMKVWGYVDGYVASKENLYRFYTVPTNKLTLAQINSGITKDDGSVEIISSVSGVTAGETIFVYTVKKGTTLITTSNMGDWDKWQLTNNLTGNGTAELKLENFKSDGVAVSCGAITVSGSAIKVSNDKYTFDFYKLAIDSTGKVTVSKIGASQIITVTNNQTPFVVEKLSNTVASQALADVAGVFKYTINGVEIPAENVYAGDITLTNTNQVYVRTLNIEYKNDKTNTRTRVELVINKLLDLE